MTHNSGDPDFDLDDLFGVDIPPGDVHAVKARAAQRRRRTRAASGATLSVLFACVVGLTVVGSSRDAGQELVVATAPLSSNAVADPLVPAFVSVANGWNEVQIEGIVDRAGVAAPIFLRAGTSSGVVVIFGDGAMCLNASTCEQDDPEPPGDLGFIAAPGPLADWSVVFLPDWTDDLHLGRASEVLLRNVDGRQQFVGARNAELALAAAPGLVPATERVVAVGIGGGGLGVLQHAGTVADNFPRAELHVLVDGYLFAPNSIAAPCLVERMRRVWGARLPMAGNPAALARQIRDSAPNARFTSILFSDDPFLRRYLGLAENGCHLRPEPVSQDVYRAEVDRFVRTLDDVVGWDAIVVRGSGHVVLGTPADRPATSRIHAALEELLS